MNGEKFNFDDRIRSVRSIMWFLAGFALLALLGSLVLLSPSHVSRYLPWQSGELNHPVDNVILIIVDTLRPDVLSCYNPDSGPTPNIDRLAGDGIVFFNAFSVAPWTLPSVASIMTGLSPVTHMALRPESKLSDSPTTIAEHMRYNGYFTTAIGSNIFLKSEYNISQGFDEYHFYPESPTDKTIDSTMVQHQSTEQNWVDISTEDLTKKTIGWLEQNAENDFFLWIHYFDPHIPYSPPVDFLPDVSPPDEIGQSFAKIDEIRSGRYDPTPREREWILSLYRSEVRYVDENIGKIIDTLEDLNLYEGSLVIFMSDHGEEFWEHGGFEHGHTLYNELLRIPLIIKLPEAAFKGQRTELVSIQSIMPTILDLCGIEYEGDYLKAYSLAPSIEDTSYIYKEQPVVSTGLLYGEEQESIIYRGMKYIRSPGSEREELFDMIDDPTERNSVLSSSPETVQQTIAILRDQMERAKELRERLRITDSEKVTIDKATEEWLKSLGYLR